MFLLQFQQNSTNINVRAPVHLSVSMNRARTQWQTQRRTKCRFYYELIARGIEMSTSLS